jgi:hypothetical protein
MKHSEILRAQRKARQIKKTHNPLLSHKKKLYWPHPEKAEANIRPTNLYKDTLEREHFGTFSPLRPIPETLQLGSNREASISHSTKRVFRMPWRSPKEEKELRRKEREKEHLQLERKMKK